MKIRHELQNNSGFTITEILISMVLNIVLISIVFIFFTNQSKVVAGQEQNMRLQQNEKNIVNLLASDVVMAGYNPNRLAITPIIGTATSMTYQQFLPPTFNTLQTTTVSFDADSKTITRTVNGAVRPIAGNIKSVEFSYYKLDGTPVAVPVTTGTSKDVRQIAVMVTAVTQKNKFGFSNVTTMKLTEVITPPNLGF